VAHRGAHAGGLQGRPDALGEHRRGALVALDRQHAELVAAEAGDHVGGALGGADHLGGPAQQAVAGKVPVGVVDQLQLVQVDGDQRGGRAVAAAAGLLGVSQPVPGAAVADAGERVGERVQLGPLEAPPQLLAVRLQVEQAGEQPTEQLDGGQLAGQARPRGRRVDAAETAEQAPVGPCTGMPANAPTGRPRRRSVPA
jgi:hypothetical protein